VKGKDIFAVLTRPEPRPSMHVRIWLNTWVKEEASDDIDLA
jgi:hypothetical protein